MTRKERNRAVASSKSVANPIPNTMAGRYTEIQRLRAENARLRKLVKRHA